MPKYVPEIRISGADYSKMENDVHSEYGMSDVATDCETLEACYSKKPKASKENFEKPEEDVLLTDIDASSDDERETVIRYPIDCINSILDLGMSCEEVSNSQGPNKRQKSITCSLERSKPRSLNGERYDEGDTDVEGMYMSEDEDAYKINSDDEVEGFEPTAFVSISDKVVTGTIVSPRVTPEPGAQRKKKTSTLRTPIPISSVLTDTEMLISDSESNSTRSRKSSKVKPFKSMFDNFASDTEDSDTSLSHTSKVNCKPNKKLSCSRSFDNIKHTLPVKSRMLAPLKKKSLDEQALTDTEHIYLDEKESKTTEKRTASRPSVIRLIKPSSPQNPYTVRYRHNAAKSKPQPTSHGPVQPARKIQEKMQKQPPFILNVPMNEDSGNATDIEAFGSDSDDQTEAVQAVAYLPNPKCELIIDNESHKGKMSIILPISDSKKSKSLKVEDLDCGYSDVEELPGFEAEEYFRYPTPDLPRTEHSTVENKEVVIERSGLRPEYTTQEPLTDTEDLDMVRKPSGNRLKVGLKPQGKNKGIGECHTDIEDLDGSDNENNESVAVANDSDLVELTDVGELSSDDSDDDIYRFTAVTPDLELNSTYTNAREAMSPFSFDVKRKVNDMIPKIRTISPSPIPRNTDTEDFLASQEDSAGSNWEASDDGHIEPHSSVVHIKHTRKFNVDHTERQHIKGYVNQPDPTTDIEELTIREALEELSQKKRKYQKTKEQNEGAVKTCYSAPKWPPCKQNARFYKTSSKHDDKSRGADKSKGAVEPSWITQRGGESVARGIGCKPEEGPRSPYDNINGIFYKEMADQTVYPPHLGYAEFESDVLGSNSSLAQEHGTDTFSELLFSSSNSESEEPDENFPVSKDNETCGILYDMSSHINKVPELFAKRSKPHISYKECEDGARLDSPSDSLESRLKYYHELCNRSLSPEIPGVSPAERAELKELEESISQMLIDIRREESLFYSDSLEEATNTVKRRPKSHKEQYPDEKFKKIKNDGESALREIESHISKLLKDVEKEEREVMGSLRRDFRKSSEKLTEGEGNCSTWDMINATCDNEAEGDVSYVRFHESSCTPSPIESSSTSEDEYDVVPKVKLNIGNKLGRSTINISLENSPTPKRKLTKMSAARRSLNRSLPSLKSSSPSLVWKDHNSTECLIDPLPLWQSSSIEYISPPERIERGSGYCIWSYPNEDEYGQEQRTEGEERTPTQHNVNELPATFKEPKNQEKNEEKRTEKSQSIEKTFVEEKTSFERQDSDKRHSAERSTEVSKKESAVKHVEEKTEESFSKENTSPGKDKSAVTSKIGLAKEKSASAVTSVLGKVEKLIKAQKSEDRPDDDQGKTSGTKQKPSLESKEEFTKSETLDKGKDTDKLGEVGKGKQKKGKNNQVEVTKGVKVEEGTTKQVIEPAKTPKAEKKTTILGKTIETIKKPFQDKAEDKTSNKAQKKDIEKGKGKQKSMESMGTPSQEIGEIPWKEQEKHSEKAIKQATEDNQMKEEINKEKSSKAPIAESIKKGAVIETPPKEHTDGKAVGVVIEQINIVKTETSSHTDIKSSEKDKKTHPEPPQSSSFSIVCVDETAKDIESKPVEKTLEAKEKVKVLSPTGSKRNGKGKPESLKPKSSDEDTQGRESASIAGPEDEKKSDLKAVAKGKGKGKDKSVTPKKPPSDEGTDVEPLIEKSVKETITGKDKQASEKHVDVKETQRKDENKGQKDDKKGKQKGKGKDKFGSSKDSSLEETTLVGKAVEIIKKPFQDQTQQKGEATTSPKTGKGKKQKSIESTKSPSLEKAEVLFQTEKSTESERQIKSDIKDGEGSEKSSKNKNGKKQDEKPADTKVKSEIKGKGKQKSIDTSKSPSPEKEKTLKDESQSKVESKTASITHEINSKPIEQKSEKPNNQDEKKKGKGKQKSIDLCKTPSLGKEDEILQEVSTPNPNLIEKTLGSIKKSFQGKKDEGTPENPEKVSKGKGGKGKTKQASIESTKTPSTDQEPKQGQPISTSSVTLIKELSQDKNGQMIEEQPIELVTKPFGNSSSSLVSLGNKGITGTFALVTESSLEKSGQLIEEEAIALVSKPFEDAMRPAKPDELTTEAIESAAKQSEDISSRLIPSSEEGITSTVSLMKEFAQDKSGQIRDEISIEFEPLAGKVVPSVKEKITTTTTVIEEVSPVISGQIINDIELAIDPKHSSKKLVAIDVQGSSSTTTLMKEPSLDKSEKIVFDTISTKLVTKPLVDSSKKPDFDKEKISSTITLIKELSQDKSGQIIEGKTIELVTDPFEDSSQRQEDSASKKLVSSTETVSTAALVKEQSSDHSEKHLKNKDKKSVMPFEDSPSELISDKTATTSTISLLKQLSLDKSGQIIEEKAIDLVARPLEDILGASAHKKENVSLQKKGESKSEESKIKSEGITADQQSKVKKKEFEHIQKTIDEAQSKLDQFVGIVSEKASKLPSSYEKGKQAAFDITPTVKAMTIQVSNTATTQGGEVEIPLEGEEQLLIIQKTIEQGLGNITSEKCEVMKKAEELPIMKPLKQEAEKMIKSGASIADKSLKRAEDESIKRLMKAEGTVAYPIKSFQEPTQNMEQKVDEMSSSGVSTVTSTIKSADDGFTVVEKIIQSDIIPQEKGIGRIVEKTTITTITSSAKQDDLTPTIGAEIQEASIIPGQTQTLAEGDLNVLLTTIEEIGQKAVGQVQRKLDSHKTTLSKVDGTPTSEPYRPEMHAQSVNIANFETLETVSPKETETEKRTISEVSVKGSSTDEIGRIIKEMESQLLSSKFGMDESAIEEASEVGSDEYTRESRTLPTMQPPGRRSLDEVSDTSDGSKPYVTTPTLSRRAIGVGGSQRLTQDERPVVRVITEYVGDLSDSEPEEDTYTVLEPEVRERRKFKIRFSPDMYGSEEKDSITEIVEVDELDTEIVDEVEDLVQKEDDSSKAKKKIKSMERRFERMTSQTKEADPSMSEVTDGEFQRIVSQLSFEEMDQALHQWDIGGLTPSEIDSKDLTLSSDDTTSPLQQGLSDIFRPKLSSILPTSIYVEKAGPDVDSSGVTENSKMKLSLVKGTVPQIFRSVEKESHMKEGSHTLEPEETGETPPIPSPRTPLKPTDAQHSNQDQPLESLPKDDDESKNYASRKMFWEQMSTGSTEAQPILQDVTPPVPKPRIRSSISQSIDLEEKKAVSHLEASTDGEVSEIGKSDVILQGVTTTDSVAHDLTTERMLSLDADTNSEVEFIKSHDIEELSYDNDAFDDENVKDLPYPEPRQRKPIYERSVSLPGDSTIDIGNNVRTKKRIFEAQIKKEMVVEQLMSQMEEEGSPEHKSFELNPDKPTDEDMLNRQIHSEIVSHELEEQIESNLLENKALVPKDPIPHIVEKPKTVAMEVSPVKTEDASESDKTNETSPELQSICETRISSTIAEVLHYKNDMITKPSESLEVCVDKSELEDTEKVKEIEDELRVIEEKYESRQLVTSEQAKVSSITSSQGESEDTFSESDVTPEDVRFKEQLDTQVWGPSEKDVKVVVDNLDEQKKPRSVHTPEEHIPDTVWEVPVQENTEPLEVETVGQLPAAVASPWQESKMLTEGEARTIAEIFVDEIESELVKSKGVTQVTDQDIDTTKLKTSEKMEEGMKEGSRLKLIRTDTTTSSMEITDEDLRSSGMTDNSPLESQVGLIPHISDQEVFGDDSGDDVDAQELDTEAIGKEVVEKTLAEVKQSLEAVKEELIEEKKKKRDSITKESPSEFEFKSLVLEKTFSESIQEHYQEDVTNIESKIHTETVEDLLSSKLQKTESHTSSGQTTTHELETTKKTVVSEKILEEQEFLKQSSTVDKASVKEETKSGEYRATSSVIAESTVSTKLISEKVTQREEVLDFSLETKEIKTPGSTIGSELSFQSTKSQDTIKERGADIQDFSTVTTKVVGGTQSTEFKCEKDSDVASISHTRVVEPEDPPKIHSRPDSDSIGEQVTENEERKSPLDDVFSTSSSSDYKGGSNEASSQDKPNIIIRKHKKSTLGAKDPKSDGEIYSSSGSHYESFEQTSESIRTPGSRPLSSDIEGFAATVAGMTTGSSEYESAVSHEISGQSTTITSKEYQTAVSSLSSRDSMKSLDSESSGNLASIEVSSEASETLVPSAMELEKDSEEPFMKQQKIAPFSTDSQIKLQSFSESIEQSVSFDISGEEISEDDDEIQAQLDKDKSQRMKRSHEMTFQPEPRPIVIEGETIPGGQDDKLNSSLDDMSSLVSTTTDTGANRTVIELSKTESERMDGSATSEQLSLTVSGTSDILSLSDSKDVEDTTVLSRVETIATQSPASQILAGVVESVTITTSSIVEQGIQSVCTQVTSKVEVQEASHSNGPTQVDYNAEYDEGDHEVKKRGHRRNGSTSFRPSMIPVFHGRDTKKKREDIVEDSAESDKYTQPLTVKEGSQEEKKDVDETERLEEEFYKTEADQAMNRDLREGRISIGDTYGEGAKSFDSSLGTKSRLPSAFSDDHPDSEIAELLKQCSSDVPSEDPIERPLTPEPVEECELKDDTPEFSSEAQASVTELEMEYSGAFSRSGEYAAHVSPIREKELPPHESWEHLSEEEQNIDDSFLHSPDPLHLGFEDSTSEKHELETQEMMSKEKPLDRSKYVSSPVPDITVTQHMHPSPQDSFENIEIEPELEKSSVILKETGAASEPTDTARTGSEASSKTTDNIKEDRKDEDSASDSPTSDSFELLEKPDIADEFVIIEEVGREASEQDMEGKSIQIDRKRVAQRAGSSSAPPPVISPPTTVTKMTQVKYFSSGATEEEIPFDFDSGSPAKSAKSEKESSQEGSPPSADEPDFKPDLEASKKWMEMQFQGEPAAQIYGYDMDYERGPLEDIKEEDINDLEGSSKIGSMGSQVSQSIGSFGSVKESLSSTPDYDVLAGRKFFTRSGEHDDVSMSSLQEFERLEHLIAMESSKHRSLGSQDSLTSSSNSRKHGSKSGGDDISLASLKEFEGLESACIAAERIETKAKAEEESLLSEIEEGHESQASESESCATISVGAMQRGESDEDDYERRMFEIDEIIRQAQTNVEQFMDSKSKETLEAGLKSETLGRADSLEEISKVPELDLDQPLYSVSYSSGKSYIQQWEDLGDDLITSTDSLEQKTQKSKTSIIDPFTTSTDSLEVKISQDVMSVSTDSIEASQKAKKKDIMTDSIEVGEKTSMITSVDSLEGKVTQANSLDEDEHHAMGTYDQSSSSGKEGDLSSSGKDDSAEGAVGMTNRMPPPRAEYLLGSTDSLEPTSSTATHATYQYETDSVMSSSFTSGDSTTMVDDEEGTARASMWFDEGKPYVTEVIEPIIGDDEFSHVIHRKVEMPPEIHKVSFKGTEAEHALREYIEKFDPGEDCTETREVDEHGNVHVKRVIQKRVIVRPEELGGDTTDLSGPDLEKYLQTLTQSQMETEPFIDSIHTSSESHSTVTTSLRTTTTTLSQGETIKTEQEQKQTVETQRRGSRPPLKYDISVDEEPEFDPREHDWRFNLHTHLERDEESQEGAYGFTDSKTKGTKDEQHSKK